MLYKLPRGMAGLICKPDKAASNESRTGSSRMWSCSASRMTWNQRPRETTHLLILTRALKRYNGRRKYRVQSHCDDEQGRHPQHVGQISVVVSLCGLSLSIDLSYLYRNLVVLWPKGKAPELFLDVCVM